MTGMTVLVLFVLFSIKHFIADFPLQTPVMYKNKGKFLHPGGILHASIHAFGTVAIMSFFSRYPFSFGVLDGAIHYTVDLFKTKLNTKLKLTPDNKYYWWLLGADQLAHYLTYALLIFIHIR